MKRSVAFIALGLLAFTTLSGCETHAPPAVADMDKERCFNRNQIQSLIPEGSQSLDVITNNNEAYALQLGSPCLDTQIQFRPALRARSGNLICGTGDAEVYYPGSTIPQVCRVTGVRHLSPDEAAALVKGGK